MGFSIQEYWSGLPFPSPEDLPDAGMEPTSPALAGGFFTTEPKPSNKFSEQSKGVQVTFPSIHKNFNFYVQ